MPLRGCAPAFLAICVAVFSLAVAHPATAQAPSPDVQRQLQERDAIIADLLRRVEALERQLSAERRSVAPAVPERTTTPATRTRSQAEETRTRSQAEEDEAVTRALERSLVTQGGQLLPPFTYEISPQFRYLTTSTSQLGIVSPTDVAPVTTRRDFFEAGVILRAGLPFGSQVDLLLPFVVEWTDTSFLGQTFSRSHEDIGDIEVMLSKQLLYESGWVPDLIAALNWKTSTGEADFDPGGRISGTGTGFHGLSALLTAVKRQDPLVFLGGLGYTYAFEDDKSGVTFEPGDSVDLRLGTILAASPDTSLRFLLTTNFVQDLKINDVEIAGSDFVASILEIGASSVLTPSLFLDFSVGIGLTENSPDFVLTLTLPYRF
jgi:hypothetical protein